MIYNKVSLFIHKIISENISGTIYYLSVFKCNKHFSLFLIHITSICIDDSVENKHGTVQD